MKKKIFIGIAILFVLHFVTWMTFGKKSLIKKQILEAESDPYCFSQDSIWAEREGSSISIHRDYDSMDTKTYRFRGVDYQVYGTESDDTDVFFDDTTTVVVERQLLSANSNPYIIIYSFACQEWYWGCGTGREENGAFATWVFFGWVKFLEEETFISWFENEN